MVKTKKDRSHNTLKMAIELFGVQRLAEVNQYTALGFLKAKYLPNVDKFYKGVFQSSDTTYSGGINHALAKWLTKNPALLESAQLWRVYPSSPKYSSKLNIEAIALIDEGHDRANHFLLRGKLYKWDEQKRTFVLKVKRNIPTPDRLKDSHLFQPSFLEINGKLSSPPQRDQFWELSCFLDDKKLVLLEDHLVANKTNFDANIVESSSHDRENDRSNLMTPARAEITLKFNSTPKVFEVANKRVEFDLVASEGTVFTVNIKAKSWRSAAKKMSDLPNWIAAVKGKLGNATDKGFELIEAGLQVFEVAPKGQLPNANFSEI